LPSEISYDATADEETLTFAKCDTDGKTNGIVDDDCDRAPTQKSFDVTITAKVPQDPEIAS
jgi:hypothetical protein